MPLSVAVYQVRYAKRCLACDMFQVQSTLGQHEQLDFGRSLLYYYNMYHLEMHIGLIQLIVMMGEETVSSFRFTDFLENLINVHAGPT